MKEKIVDNISKKVDTNIKYIKGILKDNTDIVYREFYFGNHKAALIYVDGMADKILLDEYVLQSIMALEVQPEDVSELKDKMLTVSDIKEVSKLSEGIKAFLSGETLMLIEDLDVCYVIATRSWPARGVSEPSGETAIRGAREGFTETLRFNTVLVRRRIRDTRFRVKSVSLGVRSKTDVAIMYIEDIVNKDILKEVEKRIDTINIDAVLDSGYVEQFIEDKKWSPFPQVQSTERPDVVAAAIYEGRVAIIVDNSPFAIIVPTTLPQLFQAPDDYYQRWLNGCIVRTLRLFAIFISMVMPALYVAISSFHTSIIPSKLVYSIAASREGVPFPAFVEAMIMEIFMALLLEAVTRLPKPIGSTVGIVGGVVIGQAAVSAGIISPIMLIIVALTAISSFITLNYDITSAFRLIRFLLIIAAAIIGLYGIMIGLIILLIHLIRLESFGVPYLSPMVNPDIKDFKDMFIRLPFKYMVRRPQFLNTGDDVRQKNEN